MMKSVHLTFIVTLVCYFAVSFTGYAAFGNAVTDNILNSFSHPRWVISLANALVVVHVLAGYQVYSFALYDMIEQLMHHRGVRVTRLIRVVYRVIYVISTAFFAVLLPFFGDLMGLVGAISTTPTSFVLPSILWIRVRRPSIRSLEFWINVTIAVSLSCVGLIGCIASLRSIILHASTYEVFS